MEGRDKLDHEERESEREGREEEGRKEREIMYRRRGTRLAERVDRDKKKGEGKEEKERERTSEKNRYQRISLFAPATILVNISKGRSDI